MTSWMVNTTTHDPGMKIWKCAFFEMIVSVLTDRFCLVYLADNVRSSVLVPQGPLQFPCHSSLLGSAHDPILTATLF